MKTSKNKFVFLTAVLFMFVLPQTWCQEAPGSDPDQILRASTRIEYPNSFKLNLMATYFRKITLFYERQMNGRWSFQVGAGYKFMGKIPAWTGVGDYIIASNTRGIQGFSIAPEIRYQLWNNDCEQQSGFYIGAYGALTRNFGDLTFQYWEENTQEYIDVGGAGDMWEYGFGIQLGYTLYLGEHWLFDFMFFGPRLSHHTLLLSLDSRFATEFFPMIEDELNMQLESMGYNPISIPTDGNARVDFPFRNLRYAIGVGFRF